MMTALIDAYLSGGWALCKIRPRSKKAFEEGWQHKTNAHVGKSSLIGWDGGVGLLHAWSGTCAIDVDSFKLAYPALLAHGIDLLALIQAPGALVMGRGHPDKVKLIYRLAEPLATVKRNTHGFEFRCATKEGLSMQDVLPPSIHEDGEPYRWMKGDPGDVPELPTALRRIWPRLISLFPELVAPRAIVERASSLTASAFTEAVGADAVTAEGGRDDRVSREMYRMQKQGYAPDESRELLHKFNQEKCDPPLPEHDVERIWSRKQHIEPERIEVIDPVTALPAVLEFPELPEGFEWKGKWVVLTGVPVDGVVLDSPLWVEKIVRTRALDGTEERRLDVVHVVRGDVEHHSLPVSDLLKSTDAVLVNIGINRTGNAGARVRGYLIRFKDMLEKKGIIVDTYSTFGWQANNSFLIGDRLYAPGVPVQRVALTPGLTAMATNMEVHGTVDGWRKGAAPIVADRSNIAQSFAFVMGVAAPLMKLSGERGGLFSIVGESGQGKSTVQEAIGTVFGDPRAFHSRAEDTANARMILLAQLSNLPMVAEELTKMDTAALSNLAYSISEGRDKLRADQNGVLRETAGHWNTLVVSSSNTSLLGALLLGDSTAESFRVLEDTLQLPKGSKFTDGQVAMRAMVANQGTVGHVYAQYIVDHREVLIKQIDTVKTLVAREAGAGTKERIRVNMLACAIVAAKILTACGILQLNPTDYLRYGITVLRSNEKEHVDNKFTALEILASYINAHSGEAVRTNDGNMTALGTRNMHQPLTMRYDLGLKEVSIDRVALRKHVQERKANWNDFKRDMNGALKREERAVLSKGTPMPPSPQCWVCVFGADHMTGDVMKPLTDLTGAALMQVA
jgi:ABC-type dipeptide/oligopeptide/nickel transport system ATPase component